MSKVTLVVLFSAREPNGVEKEHCARAIFDKEQFKEGGNLFYVGNYLRFWKQTSPAVLRVWNVNTANNGNQVVRVAPGDGWIEEGSDSQSPLLQAGVRDTFFKYLKDLGFES